MNVHVNMAYHKLTILLLIALLFSGDAWQHIGNFPLADCHTGQFDVLLVQTTSKADTFFHKFLSESITDAWNRGNNGNSRVRVSKVNDASATSGNNCSVKLTRFDEVVTDLCSSFTVPNFTSSSVHEDIKLKIKMVASIFTDMNVGRQNSTHVAVIIYDSSNFPSMTIAEVKRIPDFLQEASSYVKVFIIVHDFKPLEEPIFLRDILAGSYITSQAVSMALCKQCLPGWFQLQYEETGDYLSCYKLHVSPTHIDWFEATKICAEEGQFLAAIESNEELEFLQSQIFDHLLASKYLIYDTTDLAAGSVEVYIGLNRDLTSVAKRFQWTLKNQKIYRPLVLNHWLPGNPSGGFSLACGVWIYSGIFKNKFPYDQAFKNVGVGKPMFTENISIEFEGWSSVGCGTKLTPVSLCEVTLPRHVQEEDVITLAPANEKSFTRTLLVGEFQQYVGNIASVSAYANNKAFLNFMKAKKKDFPMFDCGEDAAGPRYIAYTYAIDQINHCSDGRDEKAYTENYIVFAFVLPYQACLHCECIPYTALCDIVIDCKNGNDERNCESCAGRLCGDGTCLPSHMFNDGVIDCNDCMTNGNTIINDESSINKEYNNRNETCAFICNSKQCIYPSQLNDGHIDCTGIEGPLDETIGKLERANSCVGSLQHYIWAPKCVFLKDRYGYVLGCRDLSHLQNCSDFPCQEGYYKCPGSYCIPLHYVMDGKSDCPAAEEERQIVTYGCVGNFACWNSSVCLHPDLVCDGSAHCPHKDDEVNCDMSCVTGLFCTAGTVTVDKNNPLDQLDNFSYLRGRNLYLDLSGVDLSHTIFELNFFMYILSDVKMSNCKISELNYNSIFNTLSIITTFTIDLSFNQIVSMNKDNFRSVYCMSLRELNLSYNTHLEEFADVNLKLLQILDLSYTGLTHLNNRSFYGLPNLQHLRLRHTGISTFHRDIFPAHFALETLDLRGSHIVHFSQNTYNGLVIKSSLHADNFGLCCPQVRGTSVPEYTCQAYNVTIFSCFDLIGDDTQKILIWLMAGIALIGNLIIVLYPFIYDRCLLEKAYGLIALNLGISDLLMGIYLSMITAADIYYRDVYVLYDNEWRNSVFCKIAGFLVTLTSETSIVFTFLITVDRYLELRVPYGQRQFSRVTKIGVISLSWGLGFSFALISVLSIFENDTVFTSISLCNGLLVPNHRVNGWGYSLRVIIVLNLIMPFFTAFGQVLVFTSLAVNLLSDETMTPNGSPREHNIAVTKLLSIVVLFNLLCWFPVGLMGVLSLSGHEINKDVYAWTVVLVVPVKSAVNPLLYIIPALMEKWKKFKYGNPRPH